MRGGAVAARRAHNPKVAGSNPAPATKVNQGSLGYLKLGSLAVFDSDVLLSSRCNMRETAGVCS